MIEFLKEFPWVAAAGALVSVLGAVGALIVSIVNAKNIRNIDQHINQAKRRGTFIVCPHCKKESPLSDVHFLLPDGSLDDNLNGVPDNQE